MFALVCYRRRTARRAMSVKILSTVEKVVQQIEVIELLQKATTRRLSYDKPRCHTVDDDHGEFCWKRDRLAVVTFSKWRVRGKVPYFLRYLNFPRTQLRTGGRKPPCQNQLDSSSRSDTIVQYRRVTNRRDSWSLVRGFSCPRVQLSDSSISDNMIQARIWDFTRAGVQSIWKGHRPPPQLFWRMLPESNIFLALEEIVGARRSYDI